jgi:type IV fimbrial biogenesis protein FimT
MQTTPARRQQQGLTLVESCIALLVTAVTVGTAAPAFKQARDKRHLDGVAAQLATDVRHARSLAVARHEQVRLTLRQSAAGSCYVVHTGSASDCSCAADGSASCRAGAQALQSAGFPVDGPVQVNANVGSMLFDADRGTVSPAGTLKVQDGTGRAVHQVVSVMGRVRACSPAGTAAGYPAC